MAEFVRVADVTDLPDPGKLLVEVDGDVVALFHVEGRFHAIDDICTHDGGTLADGELVGHKIACPRHGAKFDIRTGAALSMPAVRPTRCHDVKVENGGVWVRLGTGHGSTPGPDNQAADFRSYTPTNTASADAAASPATAAAAAIPAGGNATATATDGIPGEEVVREWLKEVKDPELFVNIVDLGLIYGVTLSPAADAPGKQHVAIDMTMTSPACPAGPQLIADTKRTVGSRESIASVEVRIVMDPPWTPDRMTDAARDQLGIF
jgi:metal-sulfur cluster biosynthetic enzyme/nitrite reductase/ring-hydroxylating ferredoxin subunit